MTTNQLNPGIYFNSSLLPNASWAYVAWIDVMGTANTLQLRSISVASNFIMKLQIAALDANNALQNNLALYPMIDGVYCVSEDQTSMFTFIANLYANLAQHFQLASQQGYRFLIRGGISYGSVMHGKDTVGGSAILDAAPEHRSRMLIGAPLAEAYDAERTAPPFGMAIAAPARSFAPSGHQPLVGPFLEWWRIFGAGAWHEQQAQQLKPLLIAEIDDLATNSTYTGYPAASAAKHKSLISQYLP